MAYDIVVPRLGWSMDEGVFVEWLFEPGEFVSKGSSLFVIEGDKAAEEIESFDEGILHIPEQAPQPGDSVSVGQLLGFLTAEGETPPEYKPSVSSVSIDAAKPQSDLVNPASPTPEKTVPTSASPIRDRIIATPRARRAAEQSGVALASINGTGRNGRIRERDVLNAAIPETGLWSALVSQMPLGTLQPFSNRQAHAIQRLTLAVNEAVPVTLSRRADVTRLVKHREQLNSQDDPTTPRYSLGDLIAHALVRTLVEMPAFNSYYTDKGIAQPNCVNLSVAMDTEDGLVVPVIKNADTLSLSEYAATIRSLSAAAKTNELTVEQLSGGTFTLTNLGMYGIEHFTPVLNAPQGAILGVGAVISDQSEQSPSHLLHLSLTIDHRVHDGAPAARFLQQLSETLTDWE